MLLTTLGSFWGHIKMKNRAKCKLCASILESFHVYDYVTCKCGEISISGGLDKLECSAKNWENFLRVDDDGNEIVVRVVDNADNPTDSVSDEPKTAVLTKSDKLQMLHEMIESYERLPQNAMTLPITHYDFVGALLLLQSILKEG